MAMPTIPSPQQIKDRIVSDLESSIGQTTPWLPKSWNRAIAGAVAGFIFLIYQAIIWAYKQFSPDRADWESLILLGKLVGIQPTSAIKAKVAADVFGTNGQSVLEGTRFTSGGQVYSVTSGGLISGGHANCQIECLTPGDAGNLADGVQLAIVNSDVNLTGLATVTSTVTTGADAESLEHFRARVVARYKKRYTGGSPADYELWGLEAPHFVWVSPFADNMEPGKVIIYGKVDNQLNGIPTNAQLTELATYLTQDPDTGKRYRKPTTDEIECRPISIFLFDIEIQIKNATPLLESHIQTAIAEYLSGLESYNEGISPARVDAVTNSGIASVAFAFAEEEGATVLQVVVRETISGTPVNSYILFGGEHAGMNTCTFVDIT